MAAVTPVSGNNCRGSFADGTADIRLKCVKTRDDEDLPVYTCATWKYFKVSCPKLNQQCSSLSGAWLPSITVCNQKLF